MIRDQHTQVHYQAISTGVSDKENPKSVQNVKLESAVQSHEFGVSLKTVHLPALLCVTENS